ncbi:Os08g0125450 [Oryza sativa Japonica Group]|uniref:Os08g0125450 protein n=1 Tax=Oryza sativa subsp. japonica TaxID=39947 RepID=A0A0N7KP77_ORYSJ|nr:hypothetical protein EE612_041902 [Oryza sativa]BAT03650.1 Os08g0125450 [Oryza sativa Japonica Group]
MGSPLSLSVLAFSSSSASLLFLIRRRRTMIVAVVKSSTTSSVAPTVAPATTLCHASAYSISGKTRGSPAQTIHARSAVHSLDTYLLVGRRSRMDRLGWASCLAADAIGAGMTFPPP